MFALMIGLALLGFFCFLANCIQGTVELLKVAIPYVVGFVFFLLLFLCLAGVIK